MAKAYSRIAGADRLLEKFRKLPKAVRDAMEKNVPSQAEEVASMARRLAPRGQTGNLIASIRTERQTEIRSAIIAGGTAATQREVREGSGVFTDEAMFVEFGTKAHRAGGKFKGAIIPAQPARPFFFPAWRAMKKRIRSKLSRETTKAIKQVAQGGR